MEDTLAEVQRLAGLSGEVTRIEIIKSLRNTLYSIESQDETLARLMLLVRHKQHPKYSSSTDTCPGSNEMITIQAFASSSRSCPCGHQHEGL